MVPATQFLSIGQLDNKTNHHKRLSMSSGGHDQLKSDDQYPSCQPVPDQPLKSLQCPRDVTRLGVWRLRLRLCWGFWWPSYVLAWVLSWDVEPHPVVAPLVTRPYCGSN